MVLAHATYLANRGHAVCIKANVVDTIFAIDPAIRVVQIEFVSKLETQLSQLIKTCNTL